MKSFSKHRNILILVRGGIGVEAGEKGGSGGVWVHWPVRQRDETIVYEPLDTIIVLYYQIESRLRSLIFASFSALLGLGDLKLNNNTAGGGS